MRHVLTLIADPQKRPLDDTTARRVRSALTDLGAPTAPVDWLAAGVACDIPFDSLASGEAEATARQILGPAPVDVVVQERKRRRKRLLVADMDSTMIENEMLDEIAARAGIGPQVAALTARAVSGSMDFVTALRERVALLKGFPAADLERAIKAIRIAPGAEALVRTMRAAGAYTILVTSGFRPFSNHVSDRLGFHRVVANDIEIIRGRMTGRLRPPILDADAKAAALIRLSRARGVTVSETLAVGDGGNDRSMIAAAGLGVAYRAKPILRETAPARIDHGDLTAILYLQGYRERDLRP